MKIVVSIKRDNITGFFRNTVSKMKSSSTIRNISKVYIGDILSKILAVFSMLVLIRGMTQSDYALYVIFSGVTVQFVSVIGNSINSALIRFSAEYISLNDEKPYSLYIFALFLQLIIYFAIIIYAFYFPAQMSKLLLGKEEFTSILSVTMLYGLGTLILALGQSILQAEERFNSYIGTLWLKQGLLLIVVISLWYFKFLNILLVTRWITIIQITVGIIVIIYIIANFDVKKWIQQFEREKLLIRNFLSASGWLIAYYVALAGFSRMDILMLTRFASKNELANYGVAYQYYSMALLILGSISAVLRPKFSRVDMQDKNKQRHFIKKWLKYSIWVGVPIILIIIIGKPIFVYINGIQYERSFSMFSILAFGVWLSLMFSPLVNILMSRKQFRYLFLLGVNAFIFSVIAFYVCIHYLGGVGAAIAVVLVHNVILQMPIFWKVLS